MNRDRRLPVAVVAACLGALFTAGCDECDHYGQTRCDGNMMQECIDDGDAFIHFYWTDRMPCDVICHEAEGRGACVGTRARVPECDADPNGALCLDGIPSRCWDGYLNQREACEAPTHCVVSTACGATCALEDNPEPRCPVADRARGDETYFCDGSEAFVTCTCGYVVKRGSCGSGICQEDMRGAHCAVRP